MRQNQICLARRAFSVSDPSFWHRTHSVPGFAPSWAYPPASLVNNHLSKSTGATTYSTLARRNHSVLSLPSQQILSSATRCCRRRRVVQCQRWRSSTATGPDLPHTRDPRSKQAFVALGSNVGDRLGNIEQACREIDRDGDMRIVQTSALYETEPMYVENQDRFLNGACEIETTLQPMELLDKLQAIENKAGRVKLIEKGPRCLDLDILIYEGQELSTDRLTIPHPLMKEREFVLRPLSDMPAARHQVIDGKSQMRVGDFLVQLPKSAQPMYARTPLMGEDEALYPQNPARRTRLMSILNVTPDSFSDGGMHSSEDVEYLRTILRAQIQAGAQIIDIGGQSSRPNAADISASEELSRILPAIEVIRTLPEATNVAISVDTYRAAVAEAAVQAGAHIINDISAGRLDPDMLPTIARMGCTYVMMHMRGTPATMQNEENTSYPKGVVSSVAEELGERVDAAQAVGVRRWRIVLDPGVGFAKTAQQNVEILRNFSKLKADPRVANFPWLVGSSRKSFIGKILEQQDPRQRIWGTAATKVAAVQGGADIVRVHDTTEMAQVVTVADAIYRTYI